MLHNQKVAYLNGKKYFFKERTAAGKKSWGCSPKRRLFGTPPYLCSNPLVPPISCLLKRSITLPNLTLNFPSYEACHRVVVTECIHAYSSTLNTKRDVSPKSWSISIWLHDVTCHREQSWNLSLHYINKFYSDVIHPTYFCTSHIELNDDDNNNNDNTN